MATLTSVLGLAPAAEAATWNVKCDEGKLIQALENVSDGDKVKLAKNCTYEFDWAYAGGDNALPLIDDDIVIEGNGAKIVRDADDDTQDFRLLEIDDADVVIKKLTVSGGYITDPTGGAGIQVEDGSLTATELKVLDNTIYSVSDMAAGDAFGAGISCANGCTGLALSKSTVADNVAQTISLSGVAEAYAGGIWSAGPTTLLKSSVKGNEARARGTTFVTTWAGGIYHDDDSTFILDDTKVTKNLAESRDGEDSFAFGAGIFAAGSVMTMSDSDVSGNIGTADGDEAWGGGIYLDGATTEIFESKITRNRATATGGGSSAWGGGIVQEGGSLTVDGDDEDESSEISDNKATATGFGSDAWGGGYLGFDNGTGTFNFTEFEGNSVTSPDGTARGGGLYVESTATVDLNQAEVEENSASGLVEEGGGVYAEEAGDVDTDLSEFDDNEPQDCFSGDSGEFC